MKFTVSLATVSLFAALAACSSNNANNMAAENATDMNAGMTDLNESTEMNATTDMNMTGNMDMNAETGVNAGGNTVYNNAM